MTSSIVKNHTEVDIIIKEVGKKTKNIKLYNVKYLSLEKLNLQCYAGNRDDLFSWFYCKISIRGKEKKDWTDVPMGETK